MLHRIVVVNSGVVVVNILVCCCPLAMVENTTAMSPKESSFPDSDYLKTAVGEPLKRALAKIALTARDGLRDPISLLANILRQEADIEDARQKEAEADAVQKEKDEVLLDSSEEAATNPPHDDDNISSYANMSVQFPSSIGIFATYLDVIASETGATEESNPTIDEPIDSTEHGADEVETNGEKKQEEKTTEETNVEEKVISEESEKEVAVEEGKDTEPKKETDGNGTEPMEGEETAQETTEADSEKEKEAVEQDNEKEDVEKGKEPENETVPEEGKSSETPPE
eukprot:m.24812 g.24812  ORF g.24812 m.24812 type:complete len:284 (-) comp7648_c0_seq1:134-985(-)